MGDLVLRFDDRLAVLLDHTLGPLGVVGQLAEAALHALGLAHHAVQIAPGRGELLAEGAGFDAGRGDLLRRLLGAHREPCDLGLERLGGRSLIDQQVVELCDPLAELLGLVADGFEPARDLLGFLRERAERFGVAAALGLQTLGAGLRTGEVAFLGGKLRADLRGEVKRTKGLLLGEIEGGDEQLSREEWDELCGDHGFDKTTGMTEAAFRELIFSDFDPTDRGEMQQLFRLYMHAVPAAQRAQAPDAAPSQPAAVAAQGIGAAAAPRRSPPRRR